MSINNKTTGVNIESHDILIGIGTNGMSKVNDFIYRTCSDYKSPINNMCGE